MAAPSLTPDDLTAITIAASRLARTRIIRRQDVEDTIQDLAVHLLERLPKFDPQRAGRSTFLRRCIDSYVLSMLRARNCACREPRRCRWLEDATGEVEGTRIADVLPDPRHEQNHALEERVGAVLDTLTPPQRAVADLMSSLPLVAIGPRLGLSRRETRALGAVVRTAFARAGLGHAGAPQRSGKGAA